MNGQTSLTREVDHDFQACAKCALAHLMAMCRKRNMDSRALSQRTIASAMSVRDIVSVAPSASVLVAAAAMTGANCGSAIVLSDGAIVGIITERDILTRIVAARLDPGTTSVESIMTRKPVCARPDLLVTHALYTMKELGFRHFPVVDSSRKPIGVFSLSDALGKELEKVTGLSSVRESFQRRRWRSPSTLA